MIESLNNQLSFQNKVVLLFIYKNSLDLCDDVSCVFKDEETFVFIVFFYFYCWRYAKYLVRNEKEKIIASL